MKIVEKVLLLGVENEITYHKCEACGIKLLDSEIAEIEYDISRGYLTPEDKELCWDCEFQPANKRSFKKYNGKSAGSETKTIVKPVTVYKAHKTAHGVPMRQRFIERRTRRQPQIKK